jgi:Zn-dependent peptidase ImmA (M78 family)
LNIYGSYGSYRHARDAAWKCLIDYKVSSLPVNVLSITKQAGIKVIKNSRLDALSQSEYGASLFDGERWYIIYNDTMGKEGSRLTIAHELGHIFLGHALKKGYFSMVFSEENRGTEKAADAFAIRLLAPSCVLWGKNLFNTGEIAKACDIPKLEAQKRARRLAVLNKRGKYLNNPLEQKVFEQFCMKTFI